MNLDHDFVQVWKFSEDQKKNANRTLFFPEFRWRPKKRVSSKIEHFFSPILGEDQKKRSSAREEHFFPKFTLRCTPFQIIGGGYAEVNHSQTIEGDTAKLLGGIYPPRVSAPLIESLLLARQHIFHSHNVVKKKKNVVLL